MEGGNGMPLLHTHRCLKLSPASHTKVHGRPLIVRLQQLIRALCCPHPHAILVHRGVAHKCGPVPQCEHVHNPQTSGGARTTITHWAANRA
jgi:hypothetical protein